MGCLGKGGGFPCGPMGVSKRHLLLLLSLPLLLWDLVPPGCKVRWVSTTT